LAQQVPETDTRMVSLFANPNVYGTRPACLALLSISFSLSLLPSLARRPQKNGIDTKGPLKVEASLSLPPHLIDNHAKNASTRSPMTDVSVNFSQPNKSVLSVGFSSNFVSYVSAILATRDANWCQEVSGLKPGVAGTCRIGCRCSFLRVCMLDPHSKAMHISPGSGALGTCSVDTVQLAGVMMLVLFMCGLLLRRCVQRGSRANNVRADAIARKLRKMLPMDSLQLESVLECVTGAEDSALRRAELEDQLREATPMSVRQSQLILGHFFNFDSECHDECSTKTRRREQRARLSAQRKFTADEVHNLPGTEMTQIVDTKKRAKQGWKRQC